MTANQTFVILRRSGEILLNLLAATLGTAIFETGFYRFANPRTFRGLFLKELLLSTVIAFALGALAFYLLRQSAAKWLWLPGLVGLAVLVFLASRDTSLQLFSNRATFTFVCCRLISYSLGAIGCSAIVKRRYIEPANASLETPNLPL